MIISPSSDGSQSVHPSHSLTPIYLVYVQTYSGLTLCLLQVATFISMHSNTLLSLQDGRKIAYGGMQGIPMIATSPGKRSQAAGQVPPSHHFNISSPSWSALWSQPGGHPRLPTSLEIPDGLRPPPGDGQDGPEQSAVPAFSGPGNNWSLLWETSLIAEIFWYTNFQF